MKRKPQQPWELFRERAKKREEEEKALTMLRTPDRSRLLLVIKARLDPWNQGDGAARGIQRALCLPALHGVQNIEYSSCTCPSLHGEHIVALVTNPVTVFAAHDVHSDCPPRELNRPTPHSTQS